jgi:putative ABC transport system permease protein
VATLGAGLRNSVVDALNHQVKANYVLSPSSTNTMFFPTAAEAALSRMPGVAFVSGVRGDRANILGSAGVVAGVDPATIGRAYHFAWKEGSDAALSNLGDGAILDSDYATKHHLAIGSPLTLQTSNGTRGRFVVKATYHAPQADPVLPNVVISQAAFDRTFPQPKDVQAFVTVKAGADAPTIAALRQGLHDYPDAAIDARASWVTKQSKRFNQVLDLFYVLLSWPSSNAPESSGCSAPSA